MKTALYYHPAITLMMAGVKYPLSTVTPPHSFTPPPSHDHPKVSLVQPAGGVNKQYFLLHSLSFFYIFCFFLEWQHIVGSEIRSLDPHTKQPLLLPYNSAHYPPVEHCCYRHSCNCLPFVCNGSFGYIIIFPKLQAFCFRYTVTVHCTWPGFTQLCQWESSTSPQVYSLQAVLDMCEWLLCSEYNMAEQFPQKPTLLYNAPVCLRVVWSALNSSEN